MRPAVVLTLATLTTLTLTQPRAAPQQLSQSLPKIAPAPEFTLTSQNGGEVKLADSARSGSGSGLPYGVFSKKAYTWFITAHEPLS